MGAALRACGLSVAITSGVADGFPDLAIGGLIACPNCGHRARGNALVEVKDPAQYPSARKLTPQQERFHAAWRGQVGVALYPADALRLFGLDARVYA